MSNKLTSLVLGAAAGLLAVPSCDLSIPDLNNPGLEQLQDNPTAAGIEAAATGMLVSLRGNKATPTGFVNQIGVIGRESFDFDANDGRFVTEDIGGNLQKGSPFGGSFWGGSYANIRGGNIILHALDKLASFGNDKTVAADKSATKGYVETIQAMEFYLVALTHYGTGAPVDVDHDITAPLGPVVLQADVIKKINELLEQGLTDLQAGGTKFPFPLSGFDGFDTPATFIMVNRAIKAKAAVYLVQQDKLTAADYTAVLALLTAAATPPAKASPLLNDNPASMDFDLQAGVSYTYSTNPGDTTNSLFSRKSVLAHPTLKTEAQMQSNGMPDQRFQDKVTDVLDDKDMPTTITSTNDKSLTSGITFTLYNDAGAPIPMIKNEELVLLKAEALWFTGDKTGAMTDLNLVRTTSGKLAALAQPADNAAFIDALLYERRYSLMYEGGYRWIDLRRFGKSLLATGEDSAHKENIRFPIPQGECDGRPGDAACNITSTDPIK